MDFLNHVLPGRVFLTESGRIYMINVEQEAFIDLKTGVIISFENDWYKLLKMGYANGTKIIKIYTNYKCEEEVKMNV